MKLRAKSLLHLFTPSDVVQIESSFHFDKVKFYDRGIMPFKQKIDFALRNIIHNRQAKRLNCLTSFTYLGDQQSLFFSLLLLILRRGLIVLFSQYQ